MASGLVDRYSRSGKPRPLVLYTDRDCCTMEGLSKLNALFAGWDGLPVRLDVWHFMRRLAGGVMNESHPLYGIFMQRLSGCIFEWDAQDHRLLLSAKKSMMVAAGMTSPSEVAVRKLSPGISSFTVYSGLFMMVLAYELHEWGEA